MEKKSTLTGIILLVLGAFVLAVPVIVNRFVENAGMGGMHMPMACDVTWKAEIAVGAAIIVLAILHIRATTEKKKNVTSVLLLLGGLSALLFPTAWTGVCKSADMACRMITLPSLIVLSILIIVFALIHPVRSILSAVAAHKQVV